MEQYTGFEPVPPAWKAGMLAIEHQYCIGGKGNLIRRASPRYRVKWYRFIWSLYRPLVRLKGFEPLTPASVAQCSIPLS